MAQAIRQAGLPLVAATFPFVFAYLQNSVLVCRNNAFYRVANNRKPPIPLAIGKALLSHLVVSSVDGVQLTEIGCHVRLVRSLHLRKGMFHCRCARLWYAKEYNFVFVKITRHGQRFLSMH